MNSALIDLRGVSYALNGFTILDNVSWRIEAGEHWAVLGPNGAGKTTLLKIVSGYLWPNAGGEVLRNGYRLCDLGELRKSIGWLTSTLAAEIPPYEKVLDTVISGRFAQIGFWQASNIRPARDDYARSASYLEQMGCAHLTKRSFATLSQGEQQMVLICRARMADPSLIILDEPCAGMDPGNRELFLSSLLSLDSAGPLPGLIYVTHHVEEILPPVTRIVAVKAGKLVKSGPVADVLSAETMKTLYGISVELREKNGRFWSIPL